jgi:hypothetical protein
MCYCKAVARLPGSSPPRRAQLYTIMTVTHCQDGAPARLWVGQHATSTPLTTKAETTPIHWVHCTQENRDGIMFHHAGEPVPADEQSPEQPPSFSARLGFGEAVSFVARAHPYQTIRR